MRVDPVSAGLSKLTCVSDGSTYIDSQSIQVSFLFDSTSDMIVGLGPTTSKTRHILYPNPPILDGIFLYAATHSHIHLANLLFANIALATGSSASFSALPPRNNGYISTAIEANEKSYDPTKIKFVKGTGLARANAATNRAGLFGGYTVSPTKKLRLF